MWDDIVLLLDFAVMLNLLMQPALGALKRLRVPRALGSILLILVRFAMIVGIGAAVSGPAEAWIAKLPQGIPASRGCAFSTPRSRAWAFGRRSDSVEGLRRDAKLRRRVVHHRDVSLLPASGGGQFPTAARRGLA